VAGLSRKRREFLAHPIPPLIEIGGKIKMHPLLAPMKKLSLLLGLV
jgi:hypothetical protein